MRHYNVTVAHDATAHIHRDLADAALQMMQRNMRASIVAAGTLFAEGTAVAA